MGEPNTALRSPPLLIASMIATLSPCFAQALQSHKCDHICSKFDTTMKSRGSSASSCHVFAEKCSRCPNCLLPLPPQLTTTAKRVLTPALDILASKQPYAAEEELESENLPGCDKVCQDALANRMLIGVGLLLFGGCLLSLTCCCRYQDSRALGSLEAAVPSAVEDHYHDNPDQNQDCEMEIPDGHEVPDDTW